MHPLRLFRSHQTVVTIMVTTAIIMMGQGIISPVLPLFARDFGISVTMVGVTVAVFSLGRIFFNVPAGMAAERYGRRVVLIGGLLIVTAASVYMALSQSFLDLILARFLTGVGSAIYLTGSLITLADVSNDDNRARYMSYQQGSLLFGTSIGPAVGGFAAELWGYRSAFYILAGVSALGLLWAMFQLPETARLGGTALPARQQGAPRAREQGPGTWKALLALVGRLDFLLVSFYFFMVVFTRNGGRGSILPLVGDAQAGIGPGEIGIIFTVMAVINFLIVVPAGWLADRYGRKALMLPGALITTAALAGFILAHSFWPFLAMAILLGIGTGVVGPAPAAFVTDIAPQGSRGPAIGLFRTFGDVGGMVGPVMLGWVADIGTFGWALNTNAALVALSGVGVALFARESRRSQGPARGQGGVVSG
ncbi:MAG: MFS transporter [Chloroflexi bacterium]|nr:MFS transporter [Chloroflexota bacterium]